MDLIVTHEMRSTMPTKPFMQRPAASAYVASKGLEFSKNTFAKLATVGGGPEYQIFGGRAYYTEAALDSWIAEKLSAPRRLTSDAVSA